MRAFVTLAALTAAACADAAMAQQAPPPATPVSPATGIEVREVQVSGTRAKTQVQLDRRVYTVSQSLQSITGSAADVLNEVPSVDVDPDGNVTLRGDANVTILVDGKPSAQFSGTSAGLALLQLSAADIDRIEVMTNPPPQYKASGSAGVINIITKKGRKAGLTGVARLTGGPYGRLAGGVSAAYGAGPLHLSGSLNLRHDIRRRLTDTQRTEIDPSTGQPSATAETIDEHFDRWTPSLTGAASYDLAPSRTLSVDVSWLDLNGRRHFDQLDLTGPPGQPIDSDTGRLSRGLERHVDEGAGARLEQKLWRPGETLTLALRVSRTWERERYDYDDSSALPAAPDSFSDLYLGQNLVKTEFSADYDRPLGGAGGDKGELKAGYDLERDDDNFDNLGHDIDPATGVATVDPTVTNDFRYRQTVNAAYASWRDGFGPWTIQAGVRLEATTASWRLVTTGQPGDQSYAGVYPNLRVERSLGEAAKLTADVGRRITRPDPGALNPFADHQDSYNLRAGNPALRPQDTWLAELGYAWDGHGRAWGATAYARIDRDAVTDVEQPLGGGVVLITKANLPQSRSAGLDFNANGKLWRQLSYDFSGSAFYAQIDAGQVVGTGLTGPLLKSTVGLNLKASLEYRPTGADLFQASLSRTDRRLTPQGFVSAINLVNLGYRRQLRPDLALVATVSDALDGQKFRRIVDTSALQDDYLRDQVGQIVMVGAVWTFGAPGKAKGAGLEYDP